VTDSRIDAALVAVGLSTMLQKRERATGKAGREILAGALSGGERQRMHLARALVHDAELVILDEPEAALDVDGRHALSQLLEKLTERAKVLVIAHDASIVPASFARIGCARALAA
jgi:ABC-type Mn2+/Zn2+ transport system ATPase subunit